MTLEIDSLFDLDQPTVASRRDSLAQLLQEVHPAYYLKRGVIFDYVLNPMAMFNTAHSLFWDRVRRSSSLLAISQDPELADQELENYVASNYLVNRLDGEQASGSFTIVLSALTPLSIPAGATFTSQGQQFVTQSAFTARDLAALVQLPTDRLLTPLSDGNYAFVIDVVAVDVGEAARLRKDSVVTPDDVPPNFVKAFVTNDFIGGYSAETNTSLINRLLPGVAARVLSGPVNMTAMLVNSSIFGRVIANSVIGMACPEMTRDKHSIFPGSMGGKIDWYVKMQDLPQAITLAKAATLVRIDGVASSVWQVSFTRDDAPALYDVLSVTLPGSSNVLGSFPILTELRGTDMSPLANDGFLPDIANDAESRYTRFQTATIQFQDTQTATAGLIPYSSTQAYHFTLRAMPLIAQLQDLVCGLGTRNPMGDCLVRAPVPAFVKLSFTINLVPGQAAPDLAAIANDLAAAVNQSGFTGRLPASMLANIVQGYLTGGAYAGAIDMFVRIRRPDGGFRLLRSTETVLIPEEPAQLVTPRTVAFFLDPNDVTITVHTADMP